MKPSQDQMARLAEQARLRSEKAAQERIARERQLTQDPEVEAPPPPPPPSSRAPDGRSFLQAAARYQPPAEPTYEQQPAPSRSAGKQVRYQEPQRATHPLLMALKRDLGVEDIPMADVEVGDYKWTFAFMDGSDTLAAQRMAAVTGGDDNPLVWGMSVVAISLRAIDDQPCWQIFGVDPNPTDVVTNANTPPRELRYRTAVPVLSFLQSVVPHLARELYAAYEDKFAQFGDVKSFRNDPDRPLFRYVCTEETCGEMIVREGRRDESGQLMPYWCCVHGTAMKPILKVIGEDNVPLS